MCSSLPVPWKLVVVISIVKCFSCATRLSIWQRINRHLIGFKECLASTNTFCRRHYKLLTFSRLLCTVGSEHFWQNHLHQAWFKLYSNFLLYNRLPLSSERQKLKGMSFFPILCVFTPERIIDLISISMSVLRIALWRSYKQVCWEWKSFSFGSQCIQTISYLFSLRALLDSLNLIF